VANVSAEHDNREPSPRSYKSGRSYLKSTTGMSKQIRVKKVKTGSLNSTVKLDVKEHVPPPEEQRLRERKEKQILHQKREEAEKKLLQEEERLKKLKSRFSSIGGAKNPNFTCDFSGKAIIMK